ncbi:MAG: MFS transporter [Oculatellaceae cyanobacterium Prado106]|nr:MFS transporter [Oculatellaceae cyanobacterium Prado106]
MQLGDRNSRDYPSSLASLPPFSNVQFLPVKSSPHSVHPEATSAAASASAIASTPFPFTRATKEVIRSSLKASTLDGVFAAIFSNITTGVLLTNFLLELGAKPTQIGLLAAIPLLANLLQPIGAMLSERLSSRFLFSLWVCGPARLLWLLLVAGVLFLGQHQANHSLLIRWTLAIALLGSSIAALGSAPWLSWMAVLVPRQLRGRYFGFRNSAANLTNLISLPLLGLLISRWGGGSLQGYGLALFVGVLAGMLSLWCQSFMMDVNPQVQQAIATSEQSPATSAVTEAVTEAVTDSIAPLKPLKQVHASAVTESLAPEPLAPESLAPESLAPELPENQPLPELQIHPTSFPETILNSIAANSNFLRFLLYYGLWMFAVNLSAPFFNLYLLDNLHFNLGQTTLYNSLTAAANLLMLILWGKLADRVGNRPILMMAGVLVALTPLLWLGVRETSLSIWLGLPLLHLLMGGTGAAIDLCGNNLQISVAPLQKQSTYFGVVAAIAGVMGALGTIAGGFLAQWSPLGGLLGLFALSTGIRLIALIPLLFVQEDRSHSLRQLMHALRRNPFTVSA